MQVPIFWVQTTISPRNNILGAKRFPNEKETGKRETYFSLSNRKSSTLNNVFPFKNVEEKFLIRDVSLFLNRNDALCQNTDRK